MHSIRLEWVCRYRPSWTKYRLYFILIISNLNVKTNEIKQKHVTLKIDEKKDKIERKRKIDAHRQARLEGREAKKPKTVEAEKNSNYVKPQFDGDFGSIQALTRNMFDDDTEIPELPQAWINISRLNFQIKLKLWKNNIYRLFNVEP